ncbi:hypothetical protein AURDEDRAFT_105699 [Auricularia subglabra TFB-10046 SS5]|nr:hypothetical protein AURDEDRAFT_105699 [Auricularia subglabra TFB-10046 SS5]
MGSIPQRQLGKHHGWWSRQSLTTCLGPWRSACRLSLAERCSRRSLSNQEATQEAPLRRCSKCGAAHYCSSSCQTSDWQFHKTECVSLQQWAKMAPDPSLSVPGEAIRCLARVLRRREREGPDSPWTKQISVMQSCASSTAGNTLLLKTPVRQQLPPSAAETHTQLAHGVVKFMGISRPQDLAKFGINSAGDLVDLVSRFTTNSFTLSSPSLSPIGVCVSPTVALANHSCDPNAVVVFPSAAAPLGDETLMQIIAIKDIMPEEEVLTSYVDISLPRHLRRRDLKETYNFTCNCSACSSLDDPSVGDPRYAVWCPKGCGGVCRIPELGSGIVICLRCGAEYSPAKQDEALDRVRLGTEALEKATRLELSDPDRALRLTTNMLPLIGMPYSSHPLLGLLRLHSSLLISFLAASPSNKTLDEAIAMNFRIQRGMQDVFVEGHPVRGVALAELGKLLAMDPPEPPASAQGDSQIPPHGPQRLKLAMSTLVQARKELRVGFGDGAEIVRMVEETLGSLEKEMQVWQSGVRNVLETAG